MRVGFLVEAFRSSLLTFVVSFPQPTAARRGRDSSLHGAWVGGDAVA
jgi:hypothetical protein